MPKNNYAQPHQLSEWLGPTPTGPSKYLRARCEAQRHLKETRVGCGREGAGDLCGTRRHLQITTPPSGLKTKNLGAVEI